MSENGWLQLKKQVIFTLFSCVSVFTEYLVSICVYIHVCITYMKWIKYFVNIILKTDLSNTNTTKFMYTELTFVMTSECQDFLSPDKQYILTAILRENYACFNSESWTSMSSVLCRCLVLSVTQFCNLLHNIKWMQDNYKSVLQWHGGVQVPTTAQDKGVLNV